ncbi:MAG: MBL fold metallo-hydrolase [Candidatus Rokubacteria bacterium]|nr:MBL fold metallo-hydrolase [Candidatus Rokubacteria bacterium]
MRRAARLLVIPLVVACATMQSQSQDLVRRAVNAAGGADTLAGVMAIYEKGTVRHWEPEQSHAPGGEMRLVGDSIFEATTDVRSGTTGIDWSRRLVYPGPRPFTYTEIVTPERGYVGGIDGSSRTKQSLDAKPPAHTMSSLRLATAHRELRRSSPLLALEMSKHPDRVTGVADVTVGGTAYPEVEYHPTTNQTFTVMFDRATGLPARIRTLDYDNIWGDVTFDLVLGDWKTFDGVKVATRRTYELNGRTIADVKITDAKINGAFASDRLAIPEASRSGAAKPATGLVPYQWVLRRQIVGFYLDSDVPSFDTRASTGLRLAQIAPGIQHVVGGTHHSLVVEMKDHVVVFDAPVSDWHSTWVIAASQNKYPRKKVKYLVLTHHHMDHAGGLRAYAAEGATLVVGKGAAPYYQRVLAAPFTRNPDLPARDLSRTPIIEVADKHVLSDGTREVHAYLVENNGHSDAMLLGYVPAAQLGFVTDIWTPGAPLPEKLNPGQAAVVATIKKAGITPQKFAGGHGGVADYAPLAALEGK